MHLSRQLSLVLARATESDGARSLPLTSPLLLLCRFLSMHHSGEVDTCSGDSVWLQQHGVKAHIKFLLVETVRVCVCV